MHPNFIASARGPMNTDGTPLHEENVTFNIEDGARINKDATLALHRALEARHRRRLEDVGIRIKPYSKEEIEKRAMAGIEWQKDGDLKAEKETGGAFLYESDAELCEQRGVDMDKFAAAERRVTELRSAGTNRFESFSRRLLHVRGLDGGTELRFCKAFAMFRQAAMAAGLLRRARDGTAVTEQALDFGRTAHVFAEVGLRALA